MKLAVVVNATAQYVRRRPGLAGELRRAVERASIDAEIVETRAPAELDGVAEGFRARGVDLVATCGGDGTNFATVTALVRAYGADAVPTIALLRGGTVNTIAANLGVRGAPVEILERLCARVREDDVPVIGQDLLRVNEQYGFLFAAAMGARFLEAYYGGPTTGFAWAGALALRTVASSLVTGRFARWLFSPVDLELTVDDRPVTSMRAPRLLCAATVRDVGLGMKVTWQGGRQPGRFHLIASNLSTVKMATQLHRVLGGQPLQGEPHLDVLARTARIRFARPETFTLDGDLFRERQIDLAVGPRVWIARP